MLKIPFFKFFSKSKFSVSDKNNFKNNVGWAFSPTLKYCWGRTPNLHKNCDDLIGKKSINSSPCHPEIAAPLVADVKEAYKGGCSQSISGSSHRQKCVTICTVSGKEVLDKVGWAFSPTLKYCWGRNPNLQKAISYVSRKATRHVRGDLVPAFTLAEVFLPYYHSPRKVAFTLAEVLITLGIIGVVAAMTLPALTPKIKYKELEIQYKVASNLIHNVVSYFHSQDYIVSENIYCTANKSDIAAECIGKYRIFSEFLSEAFIAVRALNKNGGGYYANNKYYNFSGNEKFDDGLLNDGYMELNNGMSVIIESGTTSSHPIIFFDLNGIDNRPNRMGYDTFAFVIDKNDRVCPLGSPACTSRIQYAETTTDYKKSRLCNPSSNGQTNGISCSYFASIDKDFFKNLK